MNDMVSLNPVVQVREIFESLPDVLRVPIEMVVFGGELPRADISRMRWMAAQLRDNSAAVQEYAAEAEQILAQQTSAGEFGDGVRGRLRQQQDGAGKLGEQASALADQCDAAANEAEKHLCVMFAFAIDLAWRIFRMVAVGSAAGPAGQVTAAAQVQKSLIEGRTRVEFMRAALKQAYERIAAATAARMPTVGTAQFVGTVARATAFTAGVDAVVQGLQVAAGYRDASLIGEDGTNPTGIDLKSIGLAAAAGAAGAAGGMLAAKFAPTFLPAMHNSRILTGLVHGTAGAVSGLGATALITGWPQHYQDILAPLVNGGFAGAVYARAGVRPQPATTPESATPPQIIDGSGEFVPPATGRTESGQLSPANETSPPSPANNVSQEARQAWGQAREVWTSTPETTQAPALQGTMDAAAATGTTAPSEPGSPPPAEGPAPRAEAAMPTGEPGPSGTAQTPGSSERATAGPPEVTEAADHSGTATAAGQPPATAAAGPPEPIAAALRPEAVLTGRTEPTAATGRPESTGSAGRPGTTGRVDPPGASRPESTAPVEGAPRGVSEPRPATAVPRVEAGGETAPPPRVPESATAHAASPPADTPAPGTHTQGSETNGRTGEHNTTPGAPPKHETSASLDSATKPGDRIEPSATSGEPAPARNGEPGRAGAQDGAPGGSDDAAAPGAGRAADPGDGHATGGHRTAEADALHASDPADTPAPTSRDQAAEALADFHARSAEHIPEHHRLSNLSDEAVQAGLFHGNERDSLIAGMEIIRRQTTDDVPGGMVLRSTQLEGAFELAAGRPVQMLPGQGKTLMFMSHALNQAVHKGSVLLVTTADGLAHREVTEYRRVLEPYGIDVLRADQRTGFGQVTPGRPAIVVATGETVGHLCNAGHKPPRSVVIDEMDAIVDRGEKTFIRSDTGSEAAPEATVREVLDAHDFLADALAQGRLSHEDFGLRRIAEDVDVALADGTLEIGTEYWYDGQAALTPGGRERVEALPGGQRWLQDMGLSRLETAAAAEFTTRNKTHYVIDKGKVVIIDQVEHGLQRNPKTSSETRWSAEEGKAGLAQAVEAKEIRNAEAIGMSAEQHRIVVRADSESTQSITAAEIYGTNRFFDQVTGASGTLTDLGGVLQTVYGLDTPHEVAPHNPSRLVEGMPDVHENTRAKLNALAGYAQGMWNGGNGRFQEILCHRNDLVEKQVNALLRAGVPRDAIEAVDANRIAGWGASWETRLQNVFDVAGEQGKILVINRQGQRGVDIAVSDTVLADGGMHVWMTEVPEQSYIYDQAKNRTARNGQPGTAQALMSPQDAIIRDAMHLRGVREAVVYYERAVTDHHANPTSETHNTLVEAGNTLGSLVPGLQERAHHRTTADFLFRYAPVTEPSARAMAMTPWHPDEAELGGPDHLGDRTTRLAGLLGVSPAALAAAAAPEHAGALTTDTYDSGATNIRIDESHTAGARATDTRAPGNRTDPLHELLQRTHLPAAAAETLRQQLDATAPGEAVRYALSTDEQALAHLTPRRDRLATELGWDIAAIEGAEGLRHLGTATTAAQHELAQALKAASLPGPAAGRDVETPSDSAFPASDVSPARARDILGEALVSDRSAGTPDHRPGVDADSAAADPVIQSARATDVVEAAARYLATTALLDLVTEIHRRSPNSCVNNGVTAMRVLFPDAADHFSMPGGGTPLKGHDWKTVRASFRNGSDRQSASLDAAVESLRQRPGGAQVLVYKWKNTENQGSTDADNHLVLLVNDSTDRDRPNLVAVDLSASRDGNYEHDFGPKDLADRRALLNRAVPFDTWRSEQQPFLQKLPEAEHAFWTIDFDNGGSLAPDPAPRDAPRAETLDERPAVNRALRRDAEEAILARALVDEDETPERPLVSGPAAPTLGTPNPRQRREPAVTGSRPHDEADPGRTESGRADAEPPARPGNEDPTTFGDQIGDSRHRRGLIQGRPAQQGEDGIGARPTPRDVELEQQATAPGNGAEPGWRVLRLQHEVELARVLYHRPEIRQAAVAMFDRLREVLAALHPGVSIDSAFYAPENVAAGPMVPRSVSLDELRRDGNVRELMAAISNAMLRSGELPEEYRSKTTLDDGIAALLNRPDWVEKATELQLDVKALRQVRETVTGGDPDVVVDKRKFRDVRKTLRYPEEHRHIAEERTRSSDAELERDPRQQLRRGLTVQDWELLGMPLSLRELAAIPGDLVALRKSRLELGDRELPRTDGGRVDTDALESELAAQDETFRFALPLYEFDDNGRRIWDEAGKAVVSGVLTYHEVGVVDAETALALDPSEYAVPLPFGPGAARVDIARDSVWFQEVAVEQKYPVVAGLSGTAGRFASRWKWLQPKGVSDVHFAGTILAFLSPQHHSLYEQVRGMQMSGLQLVDEAVLRPDAAVSELYRAVYDLFEIPEPTGPARVAPMGSRPDDNGEDTGDRRAAADTETGQQRRDGPPGPGGHIGSRASSEPDDGAARADRSPMVIPGPGAEVPSPSLSENIRGHYEELIASGNFDYLRDRPGNQPGEPTGTAWTYSAERFAWEREWLTENGPRLEAIGVLTAAALEAENLLGLPNTAPGPLLIVQQRPGGPGEMLPTWKFRSLATDDRTVLSAIGRVARALSADEVLQNYYLSLIAARPILDQDIAATLAGLAPAERSLFRSVPRDGLYTLHYPGCRSLANASPEYLRTRFLADVILPEIGSRTFYKYLLDDVIATYQRREAHQFLDGYSGRELSAEDRIGQWFAETLTSMLDAPPAAAPEILRASLGAERGAPEERAVRTFVATVVELLAGHTDLGTYLHHRNFPEMQAFVGDVRDAVGRRHPAGAAEQIPFIRNLIGPPATSRPDDNGEDTGHRQAAADTETGPSGGVGSRPSEMPGDEDPGTPRTVEESTTEVPAAGSSAAMPAVPVSTENGEHQQRVPGPAEGESLHEWADRAGPLVGLAEVSTPLDDQYVRDWLIEHDEQVRGWRRHIHHHPEASGNEYGTARYVFEVLREAGLAPDLVLDGRGVICDFGPANGERVALRADMDALKLDVNGEEKVIHACGHDAHTAMVLAAGQALASNPDRLAELGVGVRLVFQPAEETGEGAKEMVEAGLLGGTDRSFALHCDPRLKAGEFGVVVGPMNASADKLTIDFEGGPTGYSAMNAPADRLAVDFQGPGGHTAHPEEAVDLIREMSEIMVTLQTFLNGHIGADGIEVALGRFRAGEKMNAIPDSGRIEGVIRRATVKYLIVHNFLHQRLRELEERFDGLTYTLDHEPDAGPEDSSGYAGRPDGTVDLIRAMSEFTRDLDDALTERFETGTIVTVFGKADAGYDDNASRGAGTLTGTVRRADVDKLEVERFLNERLAELKERFPGLETQLHHDELVPTVTNDPESILLFMKAIASLGPEAAAAILMSMGGDDFAHFLNHSPKNGAYVNVGIWSGEGDKYSLHQPPLGLDEHALDERALAYGARALAGTVLAAGEAASRTDTSNSDRIGSRPDDASRLEGEAEPGWRMWRLRDEVELARVLYHRPESRRAAVAMLDRLREVLVALHPDATPRQIDSAFYAPENAKAGGMVPRSVTLDELRRDGNLRELMAAVYNAMLRSGELPDNPATTTLDDGVATLLNEQDWAEKARRLGLDPYALHRVREWITDGNPERSVEKSDIRDVRNTVRYDEDRDIADERARSSADERERDQREQQRRGLTVQDWKLLGMPLSPRELAAIPGDLVVLRKSRLELHGRELPRNQHGRVDTDALESELAAQDETFRFAIPLYDLDEHGHRMRDEAGPKAVSGVLTYHEVGVVDAETASHLDPDEFAVPLTWEPGVSRVGLARDGEWFQQAAVEQGIPLLAGISGTAARFAARFLWMLPPGISEVDAAGAILAILSPQHHSLYEQVRAMQMSGMRLVDEEVFRPGAAVSELYRAVFDLFDIPAPTGPARVAPTGDSGPSGQHDRPPGHIGSRPADDRDISAPGSAQGNAVAEALAAARADVEQIVAGMGPVPHPAFGDGLDLERLDSLLSESGSPAALNHICRSRGFVGYAERVDARHIDEVVAAGGHAYFAVGKAVTDDDSPHRSAGSGRAVVEGSTVARDIDNRSLVWESRDTVASRTGGDPGRVIRVAVRPSDAGALPDIESLVAKQRSVQHAIADMRSGLAGSAKTPVNEAQLRQLGYAQTVAGDLDSFAAALGYRGYTIDDPAGPGHRSLRILDPGLVVQQSEISGTSDRSVRDSGESKRYSAHPSTAGTVVSVPASADAPVIDGIAVSAEIHEWMAGFDRRPEAASVAAALAARTEGGEAGPNSLAELLVSELRRCWDRVAGIPPHARFDPETEYTVVLAPSNPDSDSGLFVKEVLDRYPQLRGALVVLSGGAPLVYSDGTRQPPKFPAPDEAAWLLVGAERAGLRRTGSGAVEVVLDRQARTSLHNALHLQAIAKFAQYIDIGSLPDINNFLRLLEHEEFIDVDALPTYLDVEQRRAIAPLLYEDSSLLVVSRLFEDSGPPVNAVVISTDQHAGRLMPLIGKQVPAVDKIAMVTPGSSLPAFLQGGLVTNPLEPSGPDFRVEAILLEVKGLVDYTRKGEILEQRLSADVAEAFNFMGAYYPQVFRHDQSRLLENTIEPDEVRRTGEEIGTLSARELKERKAERVEQLKRDINERTRRGATRVWQEDADQAYEVLRSGRHHWLSDFAAWAAQHFDWAPEGLRAATGPAWGRALNALDADDRRLVGRLYRHYTEPGLIGAELTGQAESALQRLAHLVVSPNTVPADTARPTGSIGSRPDTSNSGRIGSRPSEDRNISATGGPEDSAPVGPGPELSPDTGPAPSEHSPAFEASEANHPTGHIGSRPGDEVPRSPQQVMREAVEYRRPVDWSDLLGDNQLLLLGEEHIHSEVRELLTQQAFALRSAGITHFGIEAPPHPVFEMLNAGREVDLGHVRSGAGPGSSYRHAVAAMARAGIKIVPFDVPNFGTGSGDPLRDVRESHMTGVITAAMRAAPGARMAVLVGALHIDRNYQNWSEDAGTLLPSMVGRLTDAGFATKSVSMRHSVSLDHRINRETFVADLTGLRGLEKLPGPLIDAVINVRTGSGDLITPVGGKPGIPPAARAVRSGQPAPTRSVEPISRPMDPIRRVLPIGGPDSQQIRDVIVDEVFSAMSDWRSSDHAYSAAALTGILLWVHGSGNSVEFHAAESGEAGRRHLRVSVAGPALSEFALRVFRRYSEPPLRDFPHRYGIQEGPAGASIWFEFDEAGPDFHPDLLARMRRHIGAGPDDLSENRLLDTNDAPASGRSAAAAPATVRLFGPAGREIVLRPGESQIFGRAMLGRDIAAPRTVSRENGVIGMDSEGRVWLEVSYGKSAVLRDEIPLEPGVRHHLEHGQMLGFGVNEASAVGIENGPGLIGSRPTAVLQGAPVESDPARDVPPPGNFSDNPIGARPPGRQPGDSTTPWSSPNGTASNSADADRSAEKPLRSTGNGLLGGRPPSESRTGDEEPSGPLPTPWTSARPHSAVQSPTS